MPRTPAPSQIIPVISPPCRLTDPLLMSQDATARGAVHRGRETGVAALSALREEGSSERVASTSQAGKQSSSSPHHGQFARCPCKTCGPPPPHDPSGWLETVKQKSSGGAHRITRKLRAVPARPAGRLHHMIPQELAARALTGWHPIVHQVPIRMPINLQWPLLSGLWQALQRVYADVKRFSTPVSWSAGCQTLL